MKRPTILLATLLVLLGTGILIWFIIRGMYYEKFININEPINLPNAGVIGDFIGGFVGTIFAFSGLLLLYETLKLQRKEFSASKAVFIKQQFDNTFFELLTLYRNIVENISVSHNNQTIRGKLFFDSHMRLLQTNFITQNALSYNRKNAVKDYQNFYVQYKNITTVYYKTLYRIYCLIEYSALSNKDKNTYAKILRAQLSDSELFFMRYNAMTEQGKKSSFYINKYNILKHLSNFELLEFKDWWSKLTPFERNGLDYFFQEIKEVLKYLIRNNKFEILEKKFNSNRYVISVHLVDHFNFLFLLKRDISINYTQSSIVNGFDRLSDKEIENLLECIVKELLISSNFNQFNTRKELDFSSSTIISGTTSMIRVGVKNTQENPLIISYLEEK